MPGFLSGGLTVLICGEEGVLSSWTLAAVMLLQSLYFSHFLPNHPHPLGSFDTHARWVARNAKLSISMIL